MKPNASFPKKAAQDLQKKNDLIADNYRSTFVQCFAVLTVSIVLYYFLASLIARLYHPDISKALQLAKEVLVSPGSAAPKPVEKLLSAVAILFFPISAFALFWLIRRYWRKIPPTSLRVIYTCSVGVGAAAILLIGYMGFAAPNPFANNVQNIQDTIARTNFDFYFISTFVYDNFLWYCMILFPAILLYLLYRDKLPGRILAPIKKSEAVLACGFSVSIAIAVFFISIFKFPYTWENKYDFNAVYYSVVQVYNGIPMLVDHFTNTYGQYPHFVVPVMKLFGLSVLSFSGIMGFLLSLCFVFLFLFLRKIIGNKLLIIFGITTVFYNCYMYFHLITPFDSCFAMFPIRWIIPFSLILYAVYYLQNRFKRLYFISFFVFALGILWTPDFGIVSFLSLVAFYCFLEFENKNSIAIINGVLFHLLVAGLSLAAAFSTYSLYNRIAYGAFPDIVQIFSTIKVFSIVGAGMLPIPLPFHPWLLVALTYITGIVISVYNIGEKKISSKTAAIFLLTAIGTLSFQYYQGRSHNWNLFLSNPWCFILLTIIADNLLSIAKKHKLFVIPAALLVFILSFSLFQTIYSCNSIAALFSEEKNRDKNIEQQTAVMKNAEAIHRMAEEKEKVLIISGDYLQGLYYSFSHTAAAINPGFQDLFLNTDYERILSFITENETTKIFFDPASFRYYDTRIPLLLSSLYDVRPATADDGSIQLLTKKKPDGATGFLLSQGQNPLVHERVDRNFDNKMRFEKGSKGMITLGNQFSIQVLFRPANVPASSYTNWQTVFGNFQDNKGVMLMQNNTNPADYFFAVSGRQIDCPVDVGAWNYFAFEFNNGIIRVFKNGRLLSKAVIQAAIQNSSLPIYIGSYHMQGGFFWGDIKELEVSNSLLDEKKIVETWEHAAGKL